MKSALVSFISGVVFALGLGVGGMTQPSKVVGFLDFAGNWDPSLIFVMLGAIGVHSLFYHAFRSRLFPLVLPAISLPGRKEIEPRLIGGSVIFGLGWGLAGYCPGPALTSLSSGNVSAVIVSAGMLIGIVAFDIKRAASRPHVKSENLSAEITQDM
jgi:uncharacterized protein